MEIILSNSSGVPIYQQIVTQVRRLIVTGELCQGDALPSMRQLAKELKISLITTKRAYEELENLGLLVTMGGKGCFVGAASPERMAEERRLELEQHLTRAAACAKDVGVPLTQFLETAQLLYGGHDEEE